MIQAGALLIAGFLAGGAPSPDQHPARLADMVREACVVTELRREEFEKVARTHRWKPTPITSASGEQAAWTVAFRDGAASLIMSGAVGNAEANPDLAALCMVSVPEPRGDWQGDIADLAVELGMTPEPSYNLGGADVRTWSRLGSQTLTAAYQPGNRTVAVTLSRQTVVHPR